MASYDFYDACDVIESGSPYSMASIADTWRNFAEACRNAASHTKGTADKVTEQYGKPYQTFGDRAVPVANWLTGVAGQADHVGSALASISKTGSSAQMEMYQQKSEVDQAWTNAGGGHDGALTYTGAQNAQRRTQQGAEVLNKQISSWEQAYHGLNPGTISPVPTRNGGSGPTGTSPRTGAASTGTGTSSGGTTRSGSSQNVPGNNSLVEGSFTHSSVIGQDGGDFAGWVKDPRTGFLIDPRTGQEFDPTSNRWIDPVTGKPFGQVVQYATRLEGIGGPSTTTGLLGGGTPQPFATGVPTGGGPLMDGGSPMLFGGNLPPSLAGGNPAIAQLQQRATVSMAAKAYAAQQLALRESQQGGRPYMPPMQSSGMAAGGGRRMSGRLVSEPRGTWTSRSGQAGLRGRRAGAVGEGPQGAATQGGRRPYLPPTGAAGEDRRKGRDRKGSWRYKDDVWSTDEAAGPAVLGEGDD